MTAPRLCRRPHRGSAAGGGRVLSGGGIQQACERCRSFAWAAADPQPPSHHELGPCSHVVLSLFPLSSGVTAHSCHKRPPYQSRTATPKTPTKRRGPRHSNEIRKCKCRQLVCVAVKHADICFQRCLASLCSSIRALHDTQLASSFVHILVAPPAVYTC